MFTPVFDIECFITLEYRKIVLGTGAASSVKGTVFLGRPWGDYARVVFQNSDLGNNIAAAGWQGKSELQTFSWTVLISLHSLDVFSGYWQYLVR